MRPFSFPQFAINEPQQTRSGCLHLLGNFSTIIYIVLQLAVVALIVSCLTHTVSLLFGFTTWTLLSFQIGINLIISFMVKCAYEFDAASWAKFKKFFEIVTVLNVLVHIAVPLCLAFLTFVNSDPEKKAYYETMTTIFVIAFGVDLGGFLWMAVPYFFLYSGSSGYHMVPSYNYHE